MFARLAIACVRARERACVREGGECMCMRMRIALQLVESVSPPSLSLFANLFAVFGCVCDYITRGLSPFACMRRQRRRPETLLLTLGGDGPLLLHSSHVSW